MSNTTKRVKEIRRDTRRQFSSEEKVRIDLDGLWGKESHPATRLGTASQGYRWVYSFR